MSTESMQPADELIHLCDRLLEGAITVEEKDRLESMVLGDDNLRRLYVEYLQLHSHLSQHHGIADSPGLRAVSLPASPPPTARGWNWMARAAAIALLAGGASTATWFLAREDNPAVAVLSDVQSARWSGSTLPTEPGSALSPGRVHLAEGLATLRFKSGAEVTLEGPAELELINGMLCRLHRGSLTAHVPEPAKGFTVLTREAKLIDHGTDFGITSDDDGNASVHVMNGEVELRHNKGGQPVRLLSHQMSAITSGRLQPATSTELEPGKQAAVEAGPSFTHEITTATGRGAATYVTSPNTPYHFSDSLLLIKNSQAKNFLRKAVLRFDLGATPLPEKIGEASLTLHFDATGYGFASLGGDARFAVYAVTDDSQDGWTDQMEWKDTPAFDPDPGKADPAKAVKVGEFLMPRGILRGPFSIQTPELAERLQQDGNRLLTLIVVRENPLEMTAGLVHGFAGNRHPNLPPPTIRVR